MADAEPQSTRTERDGARCMPRDLRNSDLDRVVKLHGVCFADYFLTGLGPNVMYRFYQSAVVDPLTVSAVMEDPEDGAIVGVAIGTLNPAFHTRLFRAHLPQFVWGLVRGLFTSTVVRQGITDRGTFFAKIFRARADDTLERSGVEKPERPEARFLDVAVHPDVRGGRTAERLVEYFAGRVFDRGAGRLGGSVKPANLGSLIMYKRLGWNVQKTGPDRVDVWTDRPSD